MKKLASPPFSHVVRRADGVYQRYRMRSRYLGKGYKQLPRTRALERRFGRRVRAYKKVKVEKVKVEKPRALTMYRCTLTVALIYSGQRNHKYKHVRVTAWSVSREDAEKLAREKLDEFATEYCKTGLWEDFNFPNVAIERVEFDGKRVGKAVVVDETKHS